MREIRSIWKSLDWLTIILFGALVLYGWINIYAAIYEPGVDDYNNIFSLNIASGKQLIWIFVASLLALVILIVDFKFFFSVPYILYALSILSLVGVLFFGHTIQGATSWYKIGSFTIQPSEFTKFATALALAKLIDNKSVKLGVNRNSLILGAIILLPAILILAQNETGTVLVFSSFIIVLYLYGLNPLIPAAGIVLAALFISSIKFEPLHITAVLFGILLIMAGAFAIVGLFTKRLRTLAIGAGACVAFSLFSFGTNFLVDNVFQPHQQRRLKALVNPQFDTQGINYQTNNSITAISSGGALGKGYLKGDLTQGDFVPEQYTDFIFTTIAEEQGFIGTFIVISLYVALLIRLTYLTQRQKSVFAKIYGYSVTSILFFHFTVNLGMTVGLFPVIGIPLPFFSYGGSSLWAFTILLFIFIKLDMHRSQILARD